MTIFYIDAKSIEDYVIQIQSRSMSDPPLSDIVFYTGTRRVSARQILEDLFVLSDIELRANEEPEFIGQT